MNLFSYLLTGFPYAKQSVLNSVSQFGNSADLFWLHLQINIAFQTNLHNKVSQGAVLYFLNRLCSPLLMAPGPLVT